ncbi:MAG: DUF1592 domain-containing protein [Opitutus sp.]|nr:DUF1592 domain-containing protein [Opitutus sp.]
MLVRPRPRRSRSLCRVLALGFAVILVSPNRANAAEMMLPPPARTFITGHCLDCHDHATHKGDLDLESLAFDLSDPRTFARWAKIHDRLRDGEMPPKDEPRPDAAELRAFLEAIATPMIAADRQQQATEGRTMWRRLNRYEYENTLRDLFDAPWLRLREMMPEDGEAHRFNKVSEALDVSYVQLSRYLSTAEAALRQVMAPQVERPETRITRHYAREQRDFVSRINIRGPLNRRVYPLLDTTVEHAIIAREAELTVGESDPARRERESMALVISTYQPTSIQFTSFQAPVSGRYRLRLSAHAVWMAPDYKTATPGRRSEPVSLYAITPPRNLRKLGSVDVAPGDTTPKELEVWLIAGESIRPDAARLFRSWPPDHKNPLETPEGMPAVAFRWLEVEGPLLDGWPGKGHRLLFGDLTLRQTVVRPSENPRRTAPGEGDLSQLRRLPPMPPLSPKIKVEAISARPIEDAAALLRHFLRQAYRRPPQPADEARFLDLVRSALAAGDSFTEAMLVAYAAVLSSPGFHYLEETPGPLDGPALAARLSYFLANSGPDPELRRLAGNGTLLQPGVLRAQTGRLLDAPAARQFVEAFADYWIDLRKMNATSPDATLYPDYQLDDLLLESAVGETQAFFAELLRRDAGVRHLVASDFAMLNERLATHYGIPGVEGVAIRAVTLPADSVRGGLLTQASVLKLTANGTTTSPVLRGAWIMERILGRTPPPPPPNLPAVEPDTRGVTTIREQLARHRTEESCAACHARIDPPGIALESFDVMGAWRARYRSLGEGEPVAGIGHNSQRFDFKLAQPVDASGALADGRAFRDVRELKQLLLSDEEQLARALVTHLIIYATGAGPRFADRPVIEAILARSRPTGWGVRTLVHEIVQSDLFRHK